MVKVLAARHSGGNHRTCGKGLNPHSAAEGMRRHHCWDSATIFPPIRSLEKLPLLLTALDAKVESFEETRWLGQAPPPSWIFPGNLSSGCTKLLAVLPMCWAYSHFGFLYFWCLPPLSAQKPFFLDKTSLNTYDGSSFHLYLVYFIVLLLLRKYPENGSFFCFLPLEDVSPIKGEIWTVLIPILS